MSNKRFESSSNSNFQSSSHPNKFSSQIGSIITSGNTEELEKFLSKNENLKYDILAKALFSSIKEKKITLIQSELLQILFRLFFSLIPILYVFLNQSRYPIVNLTDENGYNFFFY